MSGRVGAEGIRDPHRVGPEVFSLESRMSGERGRLDEWEVDG